MSVPEHVTPSELDDAADTMRRVAENVRRAVEVKDEVLADVLVALVAEGHVLVEDLPGVGKTTLARALARSLDVAFARVQGTADLLPADLVGTNVFNQREARFEFRPGPIFANVVLGLLELVRRRIGRAEVGDRGGHEQDVALGEGVLDGLLELGSGLHVGVTDTRIAR